MTISKSYTNGLATIVSCELWLSDLHLVYSYLYLDSISNSFSYVVEIALPSLTFCYVEAERRE